jgi:undecaprenyl pyrophosphate phosphatase UppP
VRTIAVVALTLIVAGCGASGARTTADKHTQPRLVQHLTGKAAERIGAAACKKLPPGTPRTIAGLRAYLQTAHPTDSVPAMLRGCRAQLHL